MKCEGLPTVRVWEVCLLTYYDGSWLFMKLKLGILFYTELPNSSWLDHLQKWCQMDHKHIYESQKREKNMSEYE